MVYYDATLSKGQWEDQEFVILVLTNISERIRKFKEINDFKDKLLATSFA
jgi:hypothetical protein